jgi:uncharacterized protein YndB with AHSA1/START domain
VGGAWELRAGGVANVEWDHTRLSHEPTPDAWKSFDGVTSTNTITRVEPPRLLSYRGDMGGMVFEVTFELTPDGDSVILAIIQSPVDDAGKASFASGWHAYLDILDDRLHGRTPRGFWSNFDRLQAQYASRF